MDSLVGWGFARSLASAAIVLSLSAPATASSLQAKRVAVEIGFDAASLAAAGVDLAGVSGMLSRLDAQAQSLSDFDAAKAIVASASAAVSNATQLARDGNQEAAQQLPALQAELAAASAALDALRSALRDVATQELSGATVAALANVDAARMRRVPVEFKVVVRTAAQWDLLEVAIRREARCARTGETLDVELAELLSTTREEAAVVSAATGLGATKAALEAILTSE